MKSKYYLLLPTMVFLILSEFSDAQCPYDNTPYVQGNAPTVLGSYIEADSCWGGDLIRVLGMVAGNTYQVSTCNTPTFDSQITMYTLGGGTMVAYDDDGCGTIGGPSVINFIPPATGDYDILLDEWTLADPCATNQTNMKLRVTLTATSGGSTSSPPDITIPVVVHVVYNSTNPSENISDQQILSQINALNADYRKLNSDTNLIPSSFWPIASDSKIEFCLASRDPNGQATTGITRTSTTTLEFSSDNAVKSAASGGHDNWDPQHYLNFWVCNLGGGLLGYAQFPADLSTSASTDGVVIGYKYFGTTGTVISPYNLGRTATHEVGHWLNLRHIWGDAACGDDFVNDTPTQEQANYSCPSFPHVTCGNGPNGDMFMNYMDYVDDRCMQMFSTGQKQRIQATLASGRNQLSLSLGCQAVGIDEMNPFFSLRVFPNPGNGLFRIDGTLPGENRITISVTDILGRDVVREISVAQVENYQLDLRDEPDGLYTILFRDTKGNSTARKIIVQR